MSLRIVYTGSRPPTPYPGVEIVHVPALSWRCLDVDRSVIPDGRVLAVFFSQNAVECVEQSGLLTWLDLGAVLCVGERTRSYIQRSVGVHVYTPTQHNYEGVVGWFMSDYKEEMGRPVAFELQGGPRHLADHVTNAMSLDVYATGVVDRAAFSAAIEEAAPDWVIFASSRAVELFAASHPATTARFAAIGPTTAATMRACNLEVDWVAPSPDLDALFSSIPGAGGR